MLTVGDLMTTELFTLKRTDSLRTARSMMTLARIRHIPVVDDHNVFLGLVTHRDILSATISQFAEVDKSVQEEIDAGIPLNEIMRRDVTTVSSQTSLRVAAELLLNHKYGCLPVVEDKVLRGIITESDFLKLTIRLMDTMERMQTKPLDENLFAASQPDEFPI
ncbi:MAG: CBS domain-containing protein [Desulfovibrio sp.]|nr:CBS domain-containing protein [Desulfovibrio sp.]MCA1985946.1 CBS domain-containing protein [Desulfovibrio sp.]